MSRGSYLRVIVSAWIVYDGKLLLIKHKGLQLWLPVGGHVEQNESLEQALNRECLEEVGLPITIVSAYSQVNSESPLPFNVLSDKNRHILEFVATTTSYSVRLQEEEIEDFIWLTTKDIQNDVCDLRAPVKEKALFVLENYSC